MISKRIRTDLQERLVYGEMKALADEERREREMYESACRYGMKEATDGFCYYPADEQWGWPEQPTDEQR